MTYDIHTTIAGQGTGDPARIADWAIEQGASRPEDVRIYLNWLYQLAPRVGINPDIAVAQWLVETSDRPTGQIPARSVPWTYGLNPAGIGVTSDAEWRVYNFLSGTKSAAVQLAHLGLYAGLDVPAELASQDPRWQAAKDAGYEGKAETLEGLTQRWAADPDYAEKIANRLNQLEALGLIQGTDPMATKKLHVVLVAGHNSVGDGGNADERRLTPKLAKAYLDAFTSAGISAEWINQTLTPGGLTGLALLTAQKIRDADAELVMVLDLHFNGYDSGVHVIVAHNRKPSGGMLASAFVQGRVPEDVMENNTLDVKFASALAPAIVAANPGMTLWGSTGIMREDQTGVGLNGSRLGMMGASAPYRDKAIRVTIEHGGINDASKPDFYNRCAKAAVAVTKQVLAGRLDPVEEPDDETPPDGDAGDPSLAAFLFGEAGGYTFNPAGPVSQLWLESGNANGAWPRLIDVREDGGFKYFVFSDGSVISSSADGVDYISKIELVK